MSNKQLFSEKEILQQMNVLALTLLSYRGMANTKYFKNYGIIAKAPAKDDSLFAHELSLGIFTVHGSQHIFETKPSDLLADQKTIQYIQSRFNGKSVAILIKKPTKKIEEVCDTHGWKIIGNRTELSSNFENKIFFRKLLKQLSIPSPQHEALTVDQILHTSYSKLSQRLGSNLVFQFSQSRKHGGLQTIFVKNHDEYEQLLSAIKHSESSDSKIIVTEFIAGDPTSMLGCVTRYGILTGHPQLQIIDCPVTTNMEWGKGQFCGHDWSTASEKYSEATSFMEKIVVQIGEYLQSRGYLGIFGIDFIYDQKKKRIFPLECNARYTGSFPMYTLFERHQFASELEKFHLRELLQIDYPEKDFWEYQNKKSPGLNGAHLSLNNKFDTNVKIKKDLLPGIYKYNDRGNYEFLESSYDYRKLQNNNFLLIDGIRPLGSVIDKNVQLGKMIFPQRILKTHTELRSDVQKTIENIYQDWVEIEP